ncbi:hypothetical protein CCM_01735 [Cordyceps militaris CM01]|uniref:Uncharacterized protein n=1 Tax=Cordyceps militaris (strain CM01) TaxID=983644 RepID=G3J703_CORMM|nr:uncharacterized protein CCM_01735 [Cordyceps militaris CM01]EGX97076.1 hypothetical protein CCM_01735 [Cordyceps militaris CM01]
MANKSENSRWGLHQERGDKSKNPEDQRHDAAIEKRRRRRKEARNMSAESAEETRMWEKGNIVPPVAGAQNDDYPAALLSQSGCRALSFVLSRNLEPVSCNLGLCIPKTTLVVTAFGSGSVFATRDIHWHPSRFWLGGCHPRKRQLPPPTRRHRQ